MKKIKDYTFVILLIVLVFYGNITLAYTKEALRLWFEKLVPSMFVVLVMVRLLYYQNVIQRIRIPFLPSLFHMNTTAFSFVMALMFLGFPNGAQLINDALVHERITQKGAQRLLYTCSFAAPGFVILTCGVVLFQSIRVGLFLFLAQILSGLILLWCTRSSWVDMCTSNEDKSISFMPSLSKALWESGKALYMIGGYLMIFMSVTGVLLQYAPPTIALVVRIVSEFSSGTLYLQQLPFSYHTLQRLTCMLLSFGGFCVHMQVMSMSEDVKASYVTYLLYRIVQSVLSLILFICFVV